MRIHTLIILLLGNLGPAEILIILSVIGLIIFLPIVISIRNEKLRVQNQFLKKDSLTVDLLKLNASLGGSWQKTPLRMSNAEPEDLLKRM